MPKQNKSIPRQTKAARKTTKPTAPKTGVKPVVKQTPPKVEKPPEEPAPPTQIYCPPSGFIIGDKKIYVRRSNRFFSSAVEVPLASINAVAGGPEVEIKAPKIPYDHWKQIVAWHRKVVKDYNAEAHISHLLTRDGEYLHVPFHQSVRRGSMTIKVDYQDADNAIIMQRLEDEYGVSTGDFHGTTHNHVVSTAFESGTDKTDEEYKQGVHFTVGKMNLPVIDIHARVRVLMSAEFDPETGERRMAAGSLYGVIKDYGRLLEIPGWDASMPEAAREALSLWHATHVPDEGFPAEWMDFIDEVAYTSYSHPTTSSYPNTQPYGGTRYGGSQGPVVAKTISPRSWSRKSYMSRNPSGLSVAASADDTGAGDIQELRENIKGAGYGHLISILTVADSLGADQGTLITAIDVLESVLPPGFWTTDEMLLRVDRHCDKNYPTQTSTKAITRAIIKKFGEDTTSSLKPQLPKLKEFMAATAKSYAYTRPWYIPVNKTAWEKFLETQTTANAS